MSQNIFVNPYILNPPTLEAGSVGDGTLVVSKLTHFTIAQEYTIICTAVDPFTVFKVIGSLDGSVGVATVGEEFYDEDRKIFLTIQQGPTTFAIGDAFTLEVANGTDLNEENINLYDEKSQKNFGPGVIGEDAGDKNVRYTEDVTDAWIKLGDLKFDSVLSGTEGNSTNITFEPGHVEAKAAIEEQSLTFTAKNFGLLGNMINVEFNDTIQAVAASLDTQNLRFVADLQGDIGNLINIEFLFGGTVGSPSVVVTGTTISVYIIQNQTTAQQVVDIINTNVNSASLVDASILGTGNELVLVAPSEPLTGGFDSIGGTGSEVVAVVGNAIKAYFASGAFSAQDLKDLLETYPEVNSLVDISITGLTTDLINETIAPVYLENGLDNYADHGNEIFEVYEQSIKVVFLPDHYTSDQLTTLLLGNTEITNLVSVSFLDDGTTLQDATAHGYLAGGFSAPSYSFNQDELTDPENFHEGNANIMIKDIVAQGTVDLARTVNIGEELLVKGIVEIRKTLNVAGESAFGKSVLIEENIEVGGNSNIKGISSLRDESGSSGADVDNVQLTLNTVRDGSKLFFYNENNVEMLWDAPTLTISTDLFIEFPETGKINKILAADTPIDIADGEHLFVTIDKQNNVDLTVVKSADVLSGEDTVRVVSRIGDYLIWSDNTLHRNTKAIRIGEVGITRLRDDDVYSEQELVDLGMDRTYLTHDAKIYIASLDKTLEQAIADDDFSGGGSGVGINYDAYGNVVIQMTPEIDTLILKSPDLQLWQIKISDNGEMVVEGVLAGTVDLIKFNRDVDDVIVQLKITNDGELYLDTDSEAGAVFDAVFFRAPNGIVWEMRSDENLNIYTKDGLGNCWKVTNSINDIVFGFKDTSDGVVHASKLTEDINLIGDPELDCGSAEVAAWRWGKNEDGVKSIFSWDSIKSAWVNLVDIQSIMLKLSNPLGSTIDFWGKKESIPSGFLPAEGQQLLIAEYPNLFETLGWLHGKTDEETFFLPDTRGVVVRGVDGDRGVDPDKDARSLPVGAVDNDDLVGSYQDDQYKSHTHTANLYFYDASGPRNYFRGSYGSSYQGARATNASGGNETRMKNINAYKIMRVK